MIVQSYLVYANPGRAAAVAEALRARRGCEVIPAQNRDMLVLVTEAEDEAAQQDIDAELEALQDVTCVAMVGGWTE